MATFTSSDGVRLAYDVVGEGPPLLLHLGAGCDRTLWAAAGYLDALSAEFRCLLYDHRGHGGSDAPLGARANHLDRYESDVVEFLDHVGVERAAFWGYSNAVATAVKVADDHPGRLSCVVASGGYVAPPRDPEALAQAVAASAAAYRDTGWEQLIAGFAADEGEIPGWMLERIRATPIDPVIGYTEARLEWGWSLWSALERIDAPLLFVMGELEDPDDQMALVAAHSRNARRERLDGVGHINGFLDAPRALAIALPFLREHAGHPAPG